MSQPDKIPRIDWSNFDRESTGQTLTENPVFGLNTCPKLYRTQSEVQVLGKFTEQNLPENHPGSKPRTRIPSHSKIRGLFANTRWTKTENPMDLLRELARVRTENGLSEVLANIPKTENFYSVRSTQQKSIFLAKTFCPDF